MLITHMPLVLLGVLLVPLGGILLWGFLRLRRHLDSDLSFVSSDGLLLAILALAAFGLGVFLTYVVLGFAH